MSGTFWTSNRAKHRSVTPPLYATRQSSNRQVISESRKKGFYGRRGRKP